MFPIFLIVTSDFLPFCHQAIWAQSRTSFKEFPEIGDDLHGFMNHVINWMESQFTSSSNRDGLATDIIRKTRHVWPGIGVYTVDEVFWLGGMKIHHCYVLSNRDHH